VGEDPHTVFVAHAAGAQASSQPSDTVAELCKSVAAPAADGGQGIWLNGDRAMQGLSQLHEVLLREARCPSGHRQVDGNAMFAAALARCRGKAPK
jgi:hypothetical protein